MDACQRLRLPFGRGSEACSIVLRLTRFAVSLVARPKSSRFVNRQGHALLFRPEALPNLARPPRAWPSFVPSSCRKTKFCSIKCKAGCAHHQEARPSFVPSSSGKTESCSIVQGQSPVLFFQEEYIPRVSGHYEERFVTLVLSLVVVLKQNACGPNEVEISSQRLRSTESCLLLRSRDLPTGNFARRMLVSN